VSWLWTNLFAPALVHRTAPLVWLVVSTADFVVFADALFVAQM
jgi:hypothetical protein